MTIRFGNQVRLAPGDRERLTSLIEHDPGPIRSFAQLRALILRHLAKCHGVSQGSEFIHWLMDREWNRLDAGSGYRV